MTDIAAAVNVQPSALYRHFPSKDALLAETIRVSLQPLSDVLERTGDGPDDSFLDDLARAAIAQRTSGVLWQREARHLDADTRAEVRDDLRRLSGRLTARLVAQRPELTSAKADQLAWSAMAALGSLAYHSLTLPDGQLETLVAAILRRILNAPAPSASEPPDTAAGLHPQSRRETILSAASRLFSLHGYSTVTVDDIGDAVGIAGPSVYNHFPSKQDILVGIITRANEWLWMELTRALAAATSPADALARLGDSYLVLATHRGELITALLTDLNHLSDDQRHHFREAQHDYITEWVALLRRIRSTLDATAARIEVQAALTVVNTTVQTPHLRRSDEGIPLLRATVTALLLPETST